MLPEQKRFLKVLSSLDQQYEEILSLIKFMSDNDRMEFVCDILRNVKLKNLAQDEKDLVRVLAAIKILEIHKDIHQNLEDTENE